ncbi:hypothetical protein AB0I54_36050 [Streptomyces sp. NPDC050625]|uniref:hypothetical protein n=1 Tax=Streptomyces sp. NPDC050625 TaxID=3154629 RepID=UPI0034325DC4
MEPLVTQVVPAPSVAREPVVVDPPVVRGRAVGDPPAPPVTGARRLAADPEAVDAVGEALAALYDAGAPAAVPVVLSAGDYCVHAAGTFAAHCDDPARRPRPADSVGLEPAGLLRRFTELTGWRGPGYVIAEPTGDGTAALRFARALAATGRAPVVYLCEVLRRPDTGAFWAVATRVRRATAQPPRSDAVPALPAGTPAPPDAAAGLDPETRRRSAVLRAHLRPRPHDPAEEQQ